MIKRYIKKSLSGIASGSLVGFSIDLIFKNMWNLYFKPNLESLLLSFLSPYNPDPTAISNSLGQLGSYLSFFLGTLTGLYTLYRILTHEKEPEPIWEYIKKRHILRNLYH